MEAAPSDSPRVTTGRGWRHQVAELAAWAGTATITTRSTVTPVAVTEVKNGTVRRALGTSIVVETDGDFKMFTQSDIDKRGVKIMRDGKPAQISDFRENDRLTATIITAAPPRVLTEREANATLARNTPAAGAPAGAAPEAHPLPPRLRPQRRHRRHSGPQYQRRLRLRQQPRLLRHERCRVPVAPCRRSGLSGSRRSSPAWASPCSGVP